MNKFLRLVAGALAAVLAGGLLSACDSSPYVAVVDGSVIKETALNQELANGDRSLAYLELVESIHQQSTGQSVALVGSGTGTRSKAWVALQLTELIQAAIVHRAVAARGQLPDAAMLDAARGVLEAEMTPTGFAAVPASYRDVLVRRLAEHAELEQPGGDAPQLQQIYQQYRADFYSQVCVRQVPVTVTKPDGRVDVPGSLAAARRVLAQFGRTHTFPGSGPGGSVKCYSQADVEAQSPGFVTTVMGLAPGQAGITRRASPGYDVVAVVSRRTEPFAGDVARVLETVILQRQPYVDAALLALDARARVTVDPAYGTWSSGGNGKVPGVVPPRVAPSTPGG